MRTAEQILRDIITDVRAMDDGDNVNTWYGPFEGQDNKDGYYISWPNLDLLVKEAETTLGVKHDS